MRNLTADMIAEYASGVQRPMLMAELYFDSGMVGIFSGIGFLDYNGNTYTGLGNLISISTISETQDTKANGITVGLNGIDASLISLALAERSRGRPFRLYIASVQSNQAILTEDQPGYILQEDGYKILLENQVVDSPYRIFAGVMDVMEYTANGQTADIRLSVENVLIVGQRPKIRRYTNEDQKKYYPNDRFLEYTNQLQDKSIVW